MNYLESGDSTEMKTVLEKFHRAGLDISRIVMTSAQRKWSSGGYNRKEMCWDSAKGITWTFLLAESPSCKVPEGHVWN